MSLLQAMQATDLIDYFIEGYSKRKNIALQRFQLNPGIVSAPTLEIHAADSLLDVYA